ncbi:MAG: rod shape-determining protein, partial [Candidatus Roizmanbacteria bacterium]|nr:rod shape-determining protein [Candidatus Roizmanbacteria bacterium]
MLLDPILGIFSYDLAIDLGTANTLVGVLGKGIVIREPSVVARHRKTKKILAIGSEAKKMLGKTPGLIEAFRPLRHGVISDFDAAYAMLKHYIQEVHQRPGGSLFHYKNWFSKFPRPRVVIGIPAGVTEVERRAVWEAALEAGAREAYLIEEPMAAALGVGLPVDTSTGSMILDIGGGTSELA